VEFLRDKRVLLCLLVLAGISAVFWGTSRYPGLDEKATMGGDDEILWPTGPATELQGPFQANHRYRIARGDDEGRVVTPERM
jgi:hypothetical protein